MEEVKKKNNHIYRHIAIALYILAAILIITGIVTMVNGVRDSFNDNRVSMNGQINDVYPNEFEEEFFDEFEDDFDDMFEDDFDKTSKSTFKGFICIASGCFCIFIATIFIFVDLHKNRTLQKMGKSVIDGLIDTVAYTKSAFKEKVLDRNKPKPYYCEYCDSLIEESDSKCQSCGATRRQRD